MKSIRKTHFFIIQIFLGFFVSIILIELICHLYPNVLPVEIQFVRRRGTLPEYIDTLNRIHENDSFLLSKMKPNVNELLKHPEFSYRVKTVSLGFPQIGFRDDGIDKNPIILAVGNSFTFGWGCNLKDVWTEILEKYSSFDVVNMGVKGYGPINQTRLLMKYAPYLKPKMILYEFFVNDVTDCQSLILKKSPTKTLAKGNITSLQPLTNWLSLHSSSYEIIKWLLKIGIYKNRKLKTKVIEYKVANNTYVFNPDLLKDTVYLDNNLNKEEFECSQKMILEASNLSKRLGAIFIVVLIPYREQIYWDIFIEKIPEWKSLNPDLPYELIIEFLASQKISFIDLRPAFKRNRNKLLYWKIDAHWTPQGNKLAVELIYEKIKQELK